MKPSEPKFAPNDQLGLYAAGALHDHGWMGDFKRVRMIIVQPPLNHVSEFSITVDDLGTWVDEVRADAEATRTNPKFVVNSENCHFCKARMTCEARSREVLATTLNYFDDLDALPALAAAVQTAPLEPTRLGVLFDKVGLIETWLSDLRASVMLALESGQPVVSSSGRAYAIGIGRPGARQWIDKAEAEAAMKKMRLKPSEMFEHSLISPTTAEKLATPKKVKKGEEPIEPPLGQRQWNKLQKLIHKPEGKPTIVLTNEVLNDLFENLDTPVSQPASDEVNLFA